MNDKELFQMLGQSLNCEPAALKAVAEVESGGKSGFLASGRPQILFEGHVFYKYLKEFQTEAFALKTSTNFPDLCYKSWSKNFYKGGEKEWERLEAARSIDQIAANMATSWGIGQIMGFNYKLCGCSGVNEMVDRMCKSQEEQITLWMTFLKNSPNCLKPLQAKNWAGFAKAYNGSGYAQNKYDTRLKAAYDKWVKAGYNS